MQQLSRPYQIAIGALLVFAVAWFTVLKPSDTAAEVTPIPTVTPAAALPGSAGAGTAVAKADGAAATSTSASAAAGADPAGAPALTPAPAAKAKAKATATPEAKTSAKPAARTNDPSVPILRDVARGKVAVVLFFDRFATDDRAVRNALSRVDRHRGKVVVRTVPIARVARYKALTTSIDVTQSPTVLAIGKGNRVRTLVGVADTLAFDQLISDVGGAGFRLRRSSR